MTVKLLLIIASLAVGHCALLGSKKCTYGPSYWCSHLHHAKECSAVQHCLTTVWANQRHDMTGSTETCFGVVKALNTVRSGSGKDADLLYGMAMACKGLESQHRAQCKELVMRDKAEVLMLLKSDLPSTAVASALGFCGGFSDSVPHPVQKVTGDYCTDCVNFFGDLREIFNNSEAEFVNDLKNTLCPRLGSLEDLCNQLITQYASMVVQIIEQQMNPQDICFLLQMCKNGSRDVTLEKLKGFMDKVHASNVSCLLCKDAAKSVQDALRDQDLQKEIENDLENILCPLLPGDLSNECKTYVAAYAPLAFQLMVTELDPESFCEMMRMCTAQNKQLPLVRLGLGPAKTNVRVLAPEKKVEASPTCALCEYVMERLVSILKQNATEEEIKEALDKVCSLLPGTLSEECTSFVNEYSEGILDLLLQEVAPQAVCTLLKLCLGDQQKPVEVLPPALKGSEECTLCEMVIGYVNEALKDNTKTVEQVLDEVCDLVPSGYKSLCVQLVDTYAPQIISALTQYDDPVKVCTAIGLCTGAGYHINSSKTHAGSPLKFVPMQEIKPARHHLLGSNECTYGPSYWCASKENAQRCKIPVEHCETKYGMKIEA